MSSVPPDVVYDEHGQTWDVYGAEFDPVILGRPVRYSAPNNSLEPLFLAGLGQVVCWPGLPWVCGSLWGSPWVWVWGGYGDRNSVPTAALDSAVGMWIPMGIPIGIGMGSVWG